MGTAKLLAFKLFRLFGKNTLFSVTLRGDVPTILVIKHRRRQAEGPNDRAQDFLRTALHQLLQTVFPKRGEGGTNPSFWILCEV
jgi:hypothetical protein